MAPKTKKRPPVLLPPHATPTTLLPIAQLLHLIIFRNKNQHRITKWWGSLTLLHRNLKRLIEALESPEAGFRKNREATLKLVTFLKEQIVPRCYLAFSALVADGQFASLGLLLLGCLARVREVLRFEGEEVGGEEVAEVEMEQEGRVAEESAVVIPTEDFGEAIKRDEVAGVDDDETMEVPQKAKTKTKKRRVLDADDDDNEAASIAVCELPPKKKKVRQVAMAASDIDSEMTDPTPLKKRAKDVNDAKQPSTTSTKPAKKIKKKKKGGDAFDDLFAGLV